MKPVLHHWATSQPEFTFCTWGRHTWNVGKGQKRVVHTERKEQRKERHQESRGQGKGKEQDRRWVVARGGGRENFLGLPLPRPRGQSGRQEAGGPGRQWRGGVRNLGLNLALPLQGSGPPVHLHAKERRNEYAARAVIGPPRPPPPPHYNFPNRILQSGPYSLAHKQFCFSALEPVNHAEREHLGRRRGPSGALLRAPPRAPPSGFVPRSPWVLGWRGKGACCKVPRQHAFGKPTNTPLNLSLTSSLVLSLSVLLLPSLSLPLLASWTSEQLQRE